MAETPHILRAKISAPRIGVALVPRGRLRATVEEALRRRLVVLSAEAGYGKTALLLDVLPTLDLPVAWVTLDTGDADLNLFAATVAAALARAVPEAAAPVDGLLVAGPDQRKVLEILLTMLDEAPPLLIVLDDFHTVEGAPQVQDLVDGLLQGLPPHAHLIIASRTWPTLRSLPRLIVQGEALQVDADRLRFTPDEVSQLLRGHDLPVSPDILEDVVRRTEGWPAAVHVAALAARAHGPKALSGTPRQIFDYLTTSVLDDLPLGLREFLLQTSILSQFTPELCRAVVPEADAAAMLEEVERRNLFLYRLDETGPRYRYHALFAEVLGRRLLWLRGEEGVAALHARAARAFEAAGQPDEAVRHYFAARALDDAERVMTPLHGDRLTAPMAYTFRDLVSRLPEEILDRHPWMTRCGASAARFVGDYRLGLDLARRTMDASAGRDPNLWAFSVHGVGAMLGHMDRHGEVAALCREALGGLHPGVEERFRRGIIADLIDAHVNLGSVDEAARLLTDFETLAVEGTQPGKTFGVNFYRGTVAAAALEYTRSAALFRASVREAEERGSLNWQLWSWLGALRSEVALGRLDEAREALARALQLQDTARERASELILSHLAGDVHLLAAEDGLAERAFAQTNAAIRDGESMQPWIFAQWGLARVLASRGDMAGAAARLQQAVAACERARLGALLPALRLWELSLLRSTGETERARGILNEVRGRFETWGSAPGLAIAAWWDLLLSPAGPFEPRMRRILSLTLPCAPDVVPFLVQEAPRTAPLLIRATAAGVERDAASSLLLAMSGAAVEPLLAALEDPEQRDAAVPLLGLIGDPRARRALRSLGMRVPALRSRTDEALGRLREPVSVNLSVRMLGGFEVRRGAAPIAEAEWKTQKVKTLLKYLLLHRHRAVPPDELVEALWPEAEPEAAAGRLKTAVKTLRQTLEPLLEGVRSTFIVRTGEGIRFAGGDRCLVDLDEYDAVAREARAHEEAGRLPAAIASLERAAALYRGDLLEEDRYADWIAAPRERRREEHLGAMEWLADLYARRRDHRRAMDAILRVLALDRLREPAYRALMTFALARGDRDAAVRAFQTCDRLLREELGVPPQPETVALYEAARGRTPA